MFKQIGKTPDPKPEGVPSHMTRMSRPLIVLIFGNTILNHLPTPPSSSNDLAERTCSNDNRNISKFQDTGVEVNSEM